MKTFNNGEISFNYPHDLVNALSEELKAVGESENTVAYLINVDPGIISALIVKKFEFSGPSEVIDAIMIPKYEKVSNFEKYNISIDNETATVLKGTIFPEQLSNFSDDFNYVNFESQMIYFRKNDIVYTISIMMPISEVNQDMVKLISSSFKIL